MLRKNVTTRAIVSCFLLLLTLLVIQPTTKAKDLGSPQTEGTRGTYVYPVVPGTDVWKQLKTHDEMITVTQIPVDILGDLLTRSLVETVLNYPLYGDMLAHNSMQHGFDSVASTFNGLQELLQRKDAASEIMAFYADMDALKIEPDWTSEQKGNYHRQFTYVEVLLAQDKLLNQLSPQQRLELLRLTWAKVQAKQSRIEIYGLEGLRSNYPQATLLRSSTQKYNCHSYAWHSQLSSNTYWMNTPGDDTYWNDGSYKHVSYCPANNAKISYASDDHSAHIDGSGSLTSKWGKLGLVKHGITHCPYNSSTINYYQSS